MQHTQTVTQFAMMQATQPDRQRAGKHGIQEDNDTTSDPIVKRLRGGGFEDDDDDYDDSAYMEDDEIEEPEDLDGDTMGTTDGADNADTAVNFDDLSADQLKRWSRPPVPESAFDSSQADLNLQWLDIDMVSDQPLPDNPNRAKKRVVGATEGEVPVIRIFGVTDKGNSIVAFIHGYTPYAFFALPEGHELKYDNIREKNAKLGKIRDTMNDRLVSAKSQRSKNFAADGNLVQGVQYIEDSKSIMGYSTAHTLFLKVYLQMPSLVPTLKRIMEEGMNLPGITAMEGTVQKHQWEDGGGASFQPFECNVPFVLRFMIDEEICGAGWLTLPKGTYEIRTSKTTNCQVRNVISTDTATDTATDTGTLSSFVPLSRCCSYELC